MEQRGGRRVTDGGHQDGDTSTSLAGKLQDRMSSLLQRSVAKSSHGTYSRAWKNLSDFWYDLYGSEPVLPLTVDAAALFLTYLDLLEYAPATIHTYFSSINYMHRLKGGSQLSSEPIIKRLLDGIDKGANFRPLRSPITLEILEKLLIVLPSVFDNPVEKVLYKALFTAMYYLCARVGEVAVSQGQAQHVLSLKDIVWQKHQETPRFIAVFTSFKHN